jgi:hypothetical protein
MYAQQYPDIIQAPPPYQNNMQMNQQLPNYYRSAEQRMADFQQLVGRYESELKKNKNYKKSFCCVYYLVNHTFATKLRALEGYEIVFICDDSGSMNTPLGN